MGGDTEREVSLMSGKKVFKSLSLLGHQVVKVDGRDYKFLSHEDYKMDLIFNALHGGIGENGVLQGFFDDLKMNLCKMLGKKLGKSSFLYLNFYVTIM